jgi:hypothetical protein
VKANDPGCGGTHGCLPPIDGYKHNAYFGACTGCHGDGVDFTVAGGTSGVSCSACHLNAFASTTCGMLGTSPPCSCDLCHAVPQVRIP